MCIRDSKLPVTGKVDDKTYFRINEAAFEKEGIHGVKGKDVVRTASKYKGVPYSFGAVSYTHLPASPMLKPGEKRPVKRRPVKRILAARKRAVRFVP